MLNISLEKVSYIVVKAREFESQVPAIDADPDQPEMDQEEILGTEEHANDATYQELVAAISTLNDDELIDLLALDWLGRGDFTADDWAAAVTQAREIHDEREVQYLVGTPLLAEYLEEGLSRLGYSCEDYASKRL